MCSQKGRRDRVWTIGCGKLDMLVIDLFLNTVLTTLTIMELAKQTLLVGGHPVDVYSHPTSSSSSSSTSPIHTLFFLHGRFGSAQEKYVAILLKVLSMGVMRAGRGRKTLSSFLL
jgi:hypothetical protein